jgi:hypothetical protein
VIGCDVVNMMCFCPAAFTNFLFFCVLDNQTGYAIPFFAVSGIRCAKNITINYSNWKRN